MAMVSDGTSCTYMVGEKYLSPDSYATGLDPADNECIYSGTDNDILRTTYTRTSQRTPMLDTPGYPDPSRFGSAHANGCQMAFCDGSVQMISYTIDAETHRRLGDRQDGLPIDGKLAGFSAGRPCLRFGLVFQWPEMPANCRCPCC